MVSEGRFVCSQRMGGYSVDSEGKEGYLDELQNTLSL